MIQNALVPSVSCILNCTLKNHPKNPETRTHTQCLPHLCALRILFQRPNGGIIAVSKVQLIANVRAPGILLARRGFLDGNSMIEKSTTEHSKFFLDSASTMHASLSSKRGAEGRGQK